MSNAPSLNKRIARTLVKSAIILICVPGILLGYIWYANAAAEMNARVFCDGIPVGSSITSEIAKFEKDIGYRQEPGGKVSVRHYGFPQEGFSTDSHTFLFYGFMSDRAYCDVSLSADGKITARNSFMQYD
jgi:hypothetical protein